MTFRGTHNEARRSLSPRSPRRRRDRGRRSPSDDESPRHVRRHSQDRQRRDEDSRPARRRRESPENQWRDQNRRSRKRTRRSRSRSDSRSRSPRQPSYRSRNEGTDASASAMQITDVGASQPTVEKEQPNFERSGKLAAESNTVAGTKIVLKYHEPPEARLPPTSMDWRMYEFKDEATLSTTELAKRSCWLLGREQAVVDFPVLHPSCSGQHAVLQFRYIERRNKFGEKIGKVRLYVLDLESANGTKLNGERIGERRFVEIRGGDVLKFGDSSREYVILMA